MASNGSFFVSGSSSFILKVDEHRNITQVDESNSTKVIVDDSYIKENVRILAATSTHLETNGVFIKHPDQKEELDGLFGKLEQHVKPGSNAVPDEVLHLCDQIRLILAWLTFDADSTQNETFSQIQEYMRQERPTREQMAKFVALLGSNACQTVQVYRDLPEALKEVVERHTREQAQIQHDMEELQERKASKEDVQELKSMLQRLEGRVSDLEKEKDVLENERDARQNAIDQCLHTMADNETTIAALASPDEKEKKCVTTGRAAKILLYMGLPIACMVAGGLVGIILGPIAPVGVAVGVALGAGAGIGVVCGLVTTGVLAAGLEIPVALAKRKEV